MGLGFLVVWDIEITKFDQYNLYFEKLGLLNFKINKFKNIEDLFNFLSSEILIYINEWWKNEYQINTNELNILECTILESPELGLL